jgi:hypothetical protein
MSETLSPPSSISTELEKLLTMFLLDITGAQNLSNINSAILAETYNSPPEGYPQWLKYFPIPVPVIKSFAFTLQFAFEDLEGFMDNKLFGEIEQAIAEALEIVDGDSPPGNSSENMAMDIFDKAKNKLKELILSKTDKNEVIQQFMSFLKKLAGDTIKQHYPGTGAENKIDLKSLRNSLEQALDNFSKPVKELEDAFKKVNMVYDLNKLNNLSGDIMCTITVNVEMQNMTVGFGENPTNISGVIDKNNGFDIKLV